VIAALLNITDSRFQGELLSRAQAAGKIRADYRIPAGFRDNLPQRLERALRAHRDDGRFSEYPFGTDLTAVEIELARALKFLSARTGSGGGRLRTVLAALMSGARAQAQAAALQRMGLDQPRTVGEWLERRLVSYALDATTRGASL
jgi:hypothetical protein